MERFFSILYTGRGYLEDHLSLNSVNWFNASSLNERWIFPWGLNRSHPDPAPSHGIKNSLMHVWCTTGNELFDIIAGSLPLFPVAHLLWTAMVLPLLFHGDPWGHSFMQCDSQQGSCRIQGLHSCCPVSFIPIAKITHSFCTVSRRGGRRTLHPWIWQCISSPML